MPFGVSQWADLTKASLMLADRSHFIPQVKVLEKIVKESKYDIKLFWLTNLCAHMCEKPRCECDRGVGHSVTLRNMLQKSKHVFEK